ncbi:MAG: hypothetical protein KAI84_00585 [Gammaproteobacteria bacterium]|nr:hypothetical protein [Gammaproteobacteria bacterium]
MKTCKLCWSITGILILAIVAMGYKFMIAGSVAPASDGREALILEPAERDLVLTEMRMFLSSVQKITQALTEENMETVVKAAREVGLAAQQAVPGSLMGKLPLAFKKLGFDTHKKFDALALDAEQLGDPNHALQQLSTLMNNCVACHSTYQIQNNVTK